MTARRQPPPRRRCPIVEPDDPIACVDYRRHHAAHRFTPDGWVCDLCAAPAHQAERADPQEGAERR